MFRGAEPRPTTTSRPALHAAMWMTLSAASGAMLSISFRRAATALPWTEVATFRWMLSGALVMAVAKFRGRSLRIRNQPRALMRALTGTAATLCGFYAIGASSLSLGDIAALSMLYPVFLALMAPCLLAERASPRVWLAMLLAILGTGLIVGPRFQIAGHVAGVTILGAWFSALSVVWLRKQTKGGPEKAESAEAVVVHFCLVAATAAMVPSLSHFKSPDAESLFWCLATGVWGAISQFAVTRAHGLDQAPRLSVINYSSIVWTHLFMFLIHGDVPRVTEVAGAALVIAAGAPLVLEAYSGRHPAKRPLPR